MITISRIETDLIGQKVKVCDDYNLGCRNEVKNKTGRIRGFVLYQEHVEVIVQIENKIWYLPAYDLELIND